MKIGVIGAGGVGGYFGARLAYAGHEVKFVARGEHLHAIKTNGLFIKSINGDFKINPETASNSLDDLNDCELVILGIKAWQIRECSSILAKTLNKNALILPLQNGVLATSELSDYFDKEQILGGMCMIFSCIESPGVINHAGIEPIITLGEIDKTIRKRTEIIQQIFNKSGVKCILTNDIESALWQKFMLICLSGLGAISNSGYGLIREVPETRKIVKNILKEVKDVAIAKRVNLNFDIVNKSLDIVDSYPDEAKSSLARDVLNGKPSEIEYQNGTVVRFGKELGIETPANKFLYGMVKLLEAKIEKEKIYNNV